jgi:signal peptidase II
MHLLLAAVLIAADQISKFWVKGSFGLGDELRLGLGFSLTYVQNNGAAFGMLRDLSVPLGPLTLDGTLLLGLLSAAVATVLLVYLLANGRRLPALPLLGLTLIFSGAIGNMIDRLRLGYVIDFIHFRVENFNFPVFNLADSCVVVGAGLVLLSNLLPKRSRQYSASQHGDAELFRDFEFDPGLEFNSPDRD